MFKYVNESDNEGYKDNLVLTELFNAASGYRFYGYIGRAGSWIDQLQVISIKPDEVNWEKLI